MSHKLYIFGIGGTGSRVVKALTMLLAAGCKLDNGFDIVVPILIDPDISNGDLDRSKDILRLYQEIRSRVNEPDDFFGQDIRTVNELANNSIHINPDHFQFKLNGVDNSTFKQYIGFDDLSDNGIASEDDKNFIRLLYSNANLNSDISIGFRGNPNMGSIVLNQFTNSEEFKRFGNTFSPGDAIFIVNSIFGGTGAAGFPLLLKSLRGNSVIPKAAQIRESPIGGITYLPYFMVEEKPESSIIDSDTFEEKTKAAIDYYNRTIIDHNKINVLYLIGNRGANNVYNNFEGRAEQKNNAHFLELAGALAVFDFCRDIKSYSENPGGTTSKTQIKEFGVERDAEILCFDDLNIQNSTLLLKPLAKYRLFTEYLNLGLNKALGISRWTKSNIKLVRKIRNSFLDEDYFESPEYKNQVFAFNSYFSEWINEMSTNKPSFSPFLETSSEDALTFIRNKNPKGNSSFKQLDTQNCLLIDSKVLRSNIEKSHTALIKLFSRSTERVLAKKNLIKK
jgi:hypothetical protein